MSQVSPWANKGSEKIINIVTAIMGKRVLQDWAVNGVSLEPTMYRITRPRVYERVKEFSPEKLGEVCAYATKFGYHFDKWNGAAVPAFVNWQGYGNLTTVEQQAIFDHPDFLEVMRWVAVATIITVAVDFSCQDKMKACWHDPEKGGWKLDPRRK